VDAAGRNATNPLVKLLWLVSGLEKVVNVVAEIERDFVILTRKRRGTITNFSITGSAEPCTPLIAVGKSFADAISCLLKNRFLVGGTSEISTAFTRIRDNRGRKLL